MKIAVYGISKNEEKFAARWAETCRDADYRVVVDTGSADATISILRKSGVKVVEKSVVPWRFDTARNLALQEVPADADVCVCLDMDELLSTGWRDAIERAWKPGISQLRYPDVRNWNPDGSPQRVIPGFKIHGRGGYRWKFAVHEVLCAAGKPNEGFCPGLQVHHRPDPGRMDKGYLEILEACLLQEPEESHYLYYLGLELISRNHLERAIAALDVFLRLETSDDGPRRSNAYRLRAWCRKNLRQDPHPVWQDLLAAAYEAPEQREAWGNLAAFSGECGRWAYALSFSRFALRCRDPGKSMFIEPMWWEGRPEQMLASVRRRLGISATVAETAQATVGSSLTAALASAARHPLESDRWIAGASESAGSGEWELALAMSLDAAKALRVAGSPANSDPWRTAERIFVSAVHALGMDAERGDLLWQDASGLPSQLIQAVFPDNGSSAGVQVQAGDPTIRRPDR